MSILCRSVKKLVEVLTVIRILAMRKIYNSMPFALRGKAKGQLNVILNGNKLSGNLIGGTVEAT